MVSEWMTISTLGTFSGAVFAVTLVTEFIKGPLDRCIKMPTQFTALLVAWLVLLGRSYVVDGALHAGTVYLDLLNGFMVALAAIGSHAVITRKSRWK